MIQYKPFEERTPDIQYRELLERILREGKTVPTQQGVPARRVIGHLLRFDLSNGFPVITERDIVSTRENSARLSGFRQALGEICAFLNGAQTLAELREFGCEWWDRWASPEVCARRGLPAGDLGPGSYGAAFRRFPTAEGEPFDQISNLIQQMKEMPHLRTHLVDPWIPQYISRAGGRTSRTVLAPCHGLFFVNLFEETGMELNPEDRELTLTHVQRSADVPVGLVYNLLHYAALAQMLAHILGYTTKELVFFIVDAHIYIKGANGESQLPDVEKMLATKPGRFPTVIADPKVDSIFDYRHHHFTITDYEPRGPRMRIWTPE